jgi:putative endonuclease
LVTGSKVDMLEHEMSAWSLYLLRCADGSIYTGITTDVTRRLGEHQSGSGGSKYLRSRRPLLLLYQRRIGNRSLASRLEYRVRNLARRCKDDVAAVDALIDAFLSPGPE